MKAATLAVVGTVAACAARSVPPAALSSSVDAPDELVLFRDAALVRQRVDVAMTGTHTTLDVKVAASVRPEQLVIADRGGLDVHEVQTAPPAGDPEPADAPAVLRLAVGAPRPGHYTLVLAYVTDRIRWDAAYTMTTTPARERARIRGALAIRNASGIALHTHAKLADVALGTSGAQAAEQLASELFGVPSSATPLTPARDLGMLALAPGETRIELLASAPPRRMHAVLVYDPMGTKLDNPNREPVRDPALGNQPSSPRLTESFEIERDERATAGLPAGPVRLLEHRADGTLVMLGESRLFDAATRVAAQDTIALGTAQGVTGRRERRELSVDEDDRRLVEEVEITIDNHRDAAAHVLLREHMYRGLDWTLAYHSAASAAKEGPQQIALRTVVPPHARQKVLYVVVYTW